MSAEKGASHATVDAMVDTNHVFLEDFASGRSGHSASPCRQVADLQEQAPNGRLTHHEDAENLGMKSGWPFL